ncbi:MAG: CHASE domain-containing protein [Chloroflexi bacterium]|nr:CHASE domain-containing protein [Chloroflexota bacterium]
MFRDATGAGPVSRDSSDVQLPRRPFTYRASQFSTNALFSAKLATAAALASFALLLAMTVGTTFAVRSFISEKSADRFSNFVQTSNSEFEADVSRRLTELLAVEGLFKTSDDISQAEFEVFAGLLKNKGGPVEALGFVRRITPVEVDAFNQAMRKRGLVGFDLTRRGGAPEYTVIEQLFPRNSGVVSLGEDLGRDSFFTDALTAAEESLLPVAVGPFESSDPNQSDASLVILSPVIRQIADEVSGSTLVRTLEGFALGVYQAKELLGGATVSQEFGDIDFRIVDVSKGARGTEIFPEAGGDSSHDWSGGQRLHREVEVGGQLWDFQYSGPHDFDLTPLEREVWIIVMVAGLVITLVAGGSTYSLIAGRRAARSDLEIVTTQLSAILDSALEGILLVDQRGRVIWANQAFANMMELGEASELAGEDVANRLETNGPDIEHRDRFIEFIREVVRDPESTVASEDVTINTPEPHSYSLSSVPVEDERGLHAGRLWVFRDVTSERAADEAKSTFVSMVSHELRTPLTSVMGFIDLAMDGAGDPVGEKTIKLLGTARSNAERLQRLVDDILDVSRLESDALRLDMDSVNVVELATDLADGVNALFVERDVKLTVEVGDEVPMIWADRGRMGQVIINLLTNALRYTSSGGDVNLRITHDSGAVAIAVIDTGLGIAPEHTGRVFEKFFRIDSKRSRPAGSTGLGLAITKSLVERMSGMITLESEIGEGSTFTVRMAASTPAS